MMNKDQIIRILIYLISVWISIKFANRYWVVGPIFGLAVVAYDSKLFRNIAREKHVFFVIASTLIYALVYWVSLRKWEFQLELLNYLIGPFTIGVVLGSVLLPYTHQVILKKSKAITRQVIAMLIVSFYLVVVIAYLNNQLGGPRFNVIAVAISLWQGIYLYLFFDKPI